MISKSPVSRVGFAAARAGAETVARYYDQELKMRRKGAGEKSYDLVSDADEASEEAIIECIRNEFPDHKVMAEEAFQSGDQAGNWAEGDLWIVDPLDGTNNFAHRIPHFAVSIAYYRDGIAQFGVVLNPMTGDLFYAEKGGGAFHDGNPIRVSTESDLDQAIVGVGFYYDRGEMMRSTLRAIEDFFVGQVHGIRRMGTASLDLCQVACGRFGVYFEYELSPWDFAAGRLVVEEAGGRVTSCRGEELPVGRSSVLSTNRQLHPAALEIVQRHFPASGE